MHAVCPDKKNGDFVKTAVHDFEGDKTYSEKLGHRFKLNFDFNSVDENQYDRLIIPGGRSPEYLRLNQRVIQIVSHFLDKNKPIASICHGSQILISTGKIKGRSMTCYPGVCSDLIMSGVNYIDIGIEDAYVDGNLVTAKAWPSHVKWIQKFIELLSKS